MAQIQEVRLPDIGPTDGVVVVEVLVQPGQQVAVDDSLITLESDKASMEVPSPVAGTLVEVRLAVGDGVEENGVLATVEVDEAAARAAPAQEASPETAPAPAPPPPAAAPPPAAPAPSPPAAALDEKVDEASFKKAHAGPAVRRFARELGVDLAKVKGSGRKGRTVKEDVQAYIKAALRSPETMPAAGVAGLALPPMPEIDFSKFGPVEEMALPRIRKVAARNLHRSWLHVPHVTQHEEADVTEMEAFRKAHAEEAKGRGFKLTPVTFLLKAAAATLKEFPQVNASLTNDGEKLVLKRYFHVGVAVDTLNGLVVPVIRDVDKKGIYELAAELLEISGRARDGKLLLKDFQGGTFSISSLGGIGGTAFTPIVNAPEVAILGVSRSTIRPVFRDGEFVPRLFLPLSLSYDHRVVDGAMACRFVVHLAGVLSDIRRLLL